MRPRILLLLFIFAIQVSAAESNYTFSLDGKPFEPYFIGEIGEGPVPGSLIVVKRLPFYLEGPGAYAFTFKNNRLYRHTPDGHGTLIACQVSDGADESLATLSGSKAKPKTINPLAELDDKALKQLRGVTLSVWPEGIEKQLARLDLSRVCIQLQSIAIKDRIPPLPAATQTLILDSGGGWGCTNLSGFRRLKQLRFLALEDTMPNEFDFGVLRGMPLRYLSLPWARNPLNLDVLASFSDLETLSANYSQFLGDGRWIAKLTNLRSLSAIGLRPPSDGAETSLDLSALAGLPKLKTLQVQQSLVKTLPASTMPALKKVSLLLSGASEEMIDVFAEANPQASISRSMNAELRSRLAKADRVLVRSGGVCHRLEADEKSIHETRDLSAIAELIAHFTVNESDSGGHCGCCGNPTFEFFHADKRVGMIAFHHGRSVRWADGTWPGDGTLKSESADFLVEWLAKHGCKGPKLELMETRQQERAAGKRQQSYNAILPASVQNDLAKADSLEKAQAAFETNVPEAKERTRLYLQLFGCDEATWALSSGLDQPLSETWLPNVPMASLQEIVLSVNLNSQEGLGATRWIFGEAHLELLKGDDAALERFARFALAHPRQNNRWRTLSVLRELGTPSAIALIRSVMADGTKPRQLAEEDSIEPGGQMSFHPGGISLPPETPDSLAAAVCLDLLKDNPSRSEVQRLKDSAPAEIRKAWDTMLTNPR